MLNGIDGVAACHEGYWGYDKGSPLILPLINLENAQAYIFNTAAEQVVREKRNAQIIGEARSPTGRKRLIDVAYYNAMISLELLRQTPRSRMIGIIRNCEGFVRSCTTITAEDPLPVGWLDPRKEFTARKNLLVWAVLGLGVGPKQKLNGKAGAQFSVIYGFGRKLIYAFGRPSRSFRIVSVWCGLRHSRKPFRTSHGTCFQPFNY